MIPKDPVLLLSYVNTKLRDYDSSLDAFCEREDVEKASIIERLEEIQYEYIESQNQFKARG